METRAKVKTHGALFTDTNDAESAYQAALKHGYKKDDINIIMSDETRKRFFMNKEIKTELGDKSMEGLALGGALGGTVVGILGAIVALSTTIVIPGLGLVVAGPLAAGLVGAGTGSIAGGLLGALIGAGFPEEHATVFESGIKEGNILITVSPKFEVENDDALLADWRKLNGRDIY